MCNQALAYSDLGEHAQALAHAEASLTLLRTQGEPALEASIHQALARALSGLGRFVEARDHLARALQLSLAERRFAVAVGTLMHWGHMLSVQGELAQGLGVLTFAAKHEAIDGPDRDFALRTSAAIESRLGPERAEPAKLAATVMSLEHLAALLMSGSDTTPRRAAQ
jgi:tetratricopeptide (TPR) repeat protein